MCYVSGYLYNSYPAYNKSVINVAQIVSKKNKRVKNIHFILVYTKYSDYNLQQQEHITFSKEASSVKGNQTKLSFYKLNHVSNL